MSFKVAITLENPRAQRIEVTIPRGMLFEAQDPRHHVQNLVVSKDYQLVVPPRSSVTVQIECFCANQSFAPPRNTAMNVTPFFTKGALRSQQETWQYFAAQPVG